ncbi:MAG TPA: ABC-2 family transporter protein [Anaerolineales bacterium]|nr:ABC-2 family transporter protein [Anaerolineales bacterium]
MKKIAIYIAIFRTQLINSMAYPADLFSRSFMMLIFMWVFFQLWQATYLSTGQNVIAGLTLADTLWYLMVAETVLLSKPRLGQEIATQVKDGSVAYLLNKPYNFLLYQLSVSLGESLMRMAVNLVFGGALVWLLVGPPPHPAALPLTLLAILLAWTLDFCIVALIGLLAFVLEDVSAFEWIYSKLVLVLGGVLIPLDFFPEWLRSFALSLPFAYTTYAPARMFIDPSIGNVLPLLGGQLAWLALFALILSFVFARGMRRLAINGG